MKKKIETRGRKPLMEADRRVTITIRLPPEMVAYLRSAGMTETILQAVAASPEYQQWLKKKG